jgi:PAS domain-containing protein
VFFDKHWAKSTENLLRTPAWEAWQKILLALKQMCDEHGVVPVIVYVPVATEIYAEYSTSESGVNWLSIRDAEIATKTSNEEAARRVAANLGIQIISIRPAYERAAREGELLYYPLDSHWTEQGSGIAASVVADAIKTLDNEDRNNTQIASTPLRQARYFGSEYGFIERTIDGRIKSWDHRAEELYGWKQNEAIGKVTHTLLKTQFPEPLEKINEEILQNGRWEGKLVHATRDGRRVEVDSNWIWDPRARQGDIIEINRPTL